MSVGVVVGDSEGSAVGWRLGDGDGTSVGECVGISVGTSVGVGEGTSDGSCVGRSVGSIGMEVDELIKRTDGLKLGTGVEEGNDGAMLGASVSKLTSLGACHNYIGP